MLEEREDYLWIKLIALKEKLIE